MSDSSLQVTKRKNVNKTLERRPDISTPKTVLYEISATLDIVYSNTVDHIDSLLYQRNAWTELRSISKGSYTDPFLNMCNIWMHSSFQTLQRFDKGSFELFWIRDIPDTLRYPNT